MSIPRVPCCNLVNIGSNKESDDNLSKVYLSGMLVLLINAGSLSPERSGQDNQSSVQSKSVVRQLPRVTWNEPLVRDPEVSYDASSSSNENTLNGSAYKSPL